MKKIFLPVILVVIVFASAFPAHIPQEVAKSNAAQFYRNYFSENPATDPIKDVFSIRYQNIETIHCFSFRTGGFILIAADDASVPVLGYSFDNPLSLDEDSPAKAWIDGYSREIYQIVTHQLSNTETRGQWEEAFKKSSWKTTTDVNPLLTTTWDQGCYYNAQCPSDPSAFFSCGHVYVGCVATAMAQVMKYHNFPPQGVGTHSYTHPTYGLQTADFGNTTYNWASMPNNVTSANTAVATISYHAGVAVNMQYDPSGSGAYTTDVPDALMNYFNFQPGITIASKNNYTNVEDFKALLRADLDQSLPIYYSGYGSGGHAWVCDGYRMSDGKFHFNWGWSGSSNGWYAIGALNPGGNTFNEDNQALLHVRPGNPDLIVRIPHPVNNAVIGVGYPVEIQGVTVRGIPQIMKLFIDGTEVLSIQNDTLSYVWTTSSDDLGSHDVKIYAFNATDTSYYQINLNVAEWISQATAFTTPSRGINYMAAVDSNVVWATAFDEGNPSGACSDFTRTTDGGQTWVPGTITNTAGLASAMIFAIDSMTAYVPMYKVSGNKPMGIYMTSDGGATWAKQTTASFTNSASFPNCVHFFNENEGWCMGDPISGEFEIYTTTNGGTTWTQVPGSAIPNPLSGEFGVVGYYSAVNDTLWFGTNMGRVYRSTDKGHNYTVSTVTALNGKYIEPSFRTGSHGLVQDKSAGSTGTLCETFDGGQTWTLVTTTGPVFATDVVYVPGTTNTWVSSGSASNMGSSYSFDGGHTWTAFAGTDGAAYMQMSWVNNHCGWAGGVNSSATENGAYRFIGLLRPPLPAPVNLQAIVTGHDVHLTWEAPSASGFAIIGYNMYRNGLKLNTSPLTTLSYTDLNVVSGQYTYCVKAIYPDGESEGDCEIVDVAVGTSETGLKGPKVFPNPVKDQITVTDAPGTLYELSDMTGKLISTGSCPASNFNLDLSQFPAGLYILRFPGYNSRVTLLKVK